MAMKAMRPSPVLFLLTVVAAVVTGFVLWNHAQRTVPGKGFFRNYNVALFADTTVLDMRYDSYYVAGAASETLYLGNLAAPLHLVSVHVPTLDTQHYALTLHQPTSLLFRQVRVKVDSPRVYLYDGTTPAIFIGDLVSSKAYFVSAPTPYFLELEPAGDSTFILTSLTAGNTVQLCALSFSIPALVCDTTLLEKQIDGLFCTAGVFQFSALTQRLYYLYHYRNTYFTTDKLLSEFKVYHTLDTITRVRIQLTSVQKEGRERKRTFKAPAFTVNRQLAVAPPFLYVHSNVLSDREDLRCHEADIIDAYDLSTGSYQASFCLPTYQGQRLRHFMVFSPNSVVALYERTLLRYDFKDRTDFILHVKAGGKTEHL